MSTTEAIGVFCDTMAPGSTLRLPTKPSTGEVTVVFCRLIFSSWSRASAWANCAFDRSICASAAR